MVTHAVCVGMTGSDKTGLCLALIEEAAIDGILRGSLEAPKVGDILVWTHTAFAERLHLRASLPSGVEREGRLLSNRTLMGSPGAHGRVRYTPAGVELAHASHPQPQHRQVAMARRDSLIEGRWRIVETELWDREALDLVVPAYIRFDRKGLGEMQLIVIGASIDYRVEQREGASVLEFSWSGFDEMDVTSGRAWARIDGDTMRGKLFIHRGDESTFVARRERGVPRVSASKAPRPPDGAAARAQRGRPRQRGFRNSGRGTGHVPVEALQGWAPVIDGWE